MIRLLSSLILAVAMTGCTNYGPLTAEDQDRIDAFCSCAEPIAREMLEGLPQGESLQDIPEGEFSFESEQEMEACLKKFEHVDQKADQDTLYFRMVIKYIRDKQPECGQLVMGIQAEDPLNIPIPD